MYAVTPSLNVWARARRQSEIKTAAENAAAMNLFILYPAETDAVHLQGVACFKIIPIRLGALPLIELELHWAWSWWERRGEGGFFVR